MPRRLPLTAHLTVDELYTRYRQATEPVARSHWQIIWLLAQGSSTAQVATATGYTQPWIRTLVHRYNDAGPPALGDRRQTNPGAAMLLSSDQQAHLATLLDAPAPDGGIWTGPKVAVWMSEHLGRPVHPQRGWEVVRRLGFTLQRLRPRHIQGDAQAQATFKKSSQLS
jgi:transposase